MNSFNMSCWNSEKTSGLISVIIPVYNVEKYLRECIQSVQKNTYKKLEIICINDGSPDNCSRILKELADEDPRILVITQVNKGVAEARNAGLEKASGEFIAFVDSDDFIHPRYFETLINCITSKNADLAVCGCCKFEDGDKPEITRYRHISYSRINDQEFFKHYYARHMIWARLYRRKDLENIRFTSEVRMADDTLYNLRILACIGNPVVYETSAELYYYRLRNDSIVHTGKSERIIDIGEWYLSNKEVFLSTTKDWGWLLLLEVMKTTLSYRYIVRYIRKDDEKHKRADRILNETFSDFCKIRRKKLKEILVHSAMIRSDRLYRIFRIIQDPTMLDWEKQSRSNKE